MADEDAAVIEPSLEAESAEEDESEGGPKPTLSDLLLTPEDKRARHEYRLNASKCCVEEAWRMYRRVTSSDYAIEPANLSVEPSSNMITRMGVLYDPTAGLRVRFLQRKFAHLFDGFMALKQAAYRPFIRCQKPKLIDQKGQGRAMPAVVKAFHPEVYVTYMHPSTFAYKEKWSKIFNSNFISKEDIRRDQEDKDVQTVLFDVYSTKKLRSTAEPRDLSVEKFDIEDIPFDNDGNPIGRSVGICEWCGKSILPIPSEKAVKTEWNMDAIYCCNKYRLFIEDVKKATVALEAEHEQRNFLIKASPGKKRKTKDIHQDQRHAAVVRGPSKALVGKMIKILQEKLTEAAEEEEKTKHVAVDTFDLPWDPAETRYRDQMHAKAEAKTKDDNIDILLELEELYSNRSSMAVHNE